MAQRPQGVGGPVADPREQADASGSVPEVQARHRATISAVASRAGVSKQTVSNVLNFPARVAPDTTERVLRAISELNFRPDRAARQLRTNRSGVLAMRMELAPGNLVFDRFLHEMSVAAAAFDYRIMLYTAADDQAELAELEDLRDARNIDGFVLTGTHSADVREPYLTRMRIPFVSFGRSWDPGVDYDWVDVDGAAGTAVAIDSLIEAGHRRIGFLGWPSGSGVGDDRLAGWQHACDRHGLPPIPPARVLDTLPDARGAAGRLLDEHAPTALVCASDTLALGAQAAVLERGLVVGHDVSLVGFDDSAIAAAAGLSSLAQPLTQAAHELARLFMARLHEPGAPPVHRLLPPDLRVRSSFGPPPAASPSPTHLEQGAHH